MDLPDNPAIGKLGRSFSADADIVVKNATEEIQVHRAAGVKTVLKHFPGSGSATGNTDFGVVDVSTTWQPSELEPFQKLIDAASPTHQPHRSISSSIDARVPVAGGLADLLRGGRLAQRRRERHAARSRSHAAAGTRP
jgi:beta-N-acetylhexosaminidase